MLVEDGPPCRAARPPPVAQPQRMNRQADDEIRRRQQQERVAPADRADRELRQRNEHRAGEAADERHRGDARAIVLRMKPRQHGECRLVERRRQRHAEAEPDRVEGADAADTRPGGEQHHGERRAQAHHPAAAAAVDPGADRIGGKAGEQQADGQGAVERGAAPAELRLHRHDEQREAVIDGAPRHELRGGKREDQSPPAVHGAKPRCARRIEGASLLVKKRVGR